MTLQGGYWTQLTFMSDDIKHRTVGRIVQYKKINPKDYSKAISITEMKVGVTSDINIEAALIEDIAEKVKRDVLSNSDRLWMIMNDVLDRAVMKYINQYIDEYEKAMRKVTPSAYEQMATGIIPGYQL